VTSSVGISMSLSSDAEKIARTADYLLASIEVVSKELKFVLRKMSSRSDLSYASSRMQLMLTSVYLFQNMLKVILSDAKALIGEK